MKEKITIKDIAKELGVSTSTVSKALKDSHEISESTKNASRLSPIFTITNPIV